MTRASSNRSQFQLVKRISNQNMSIGETELVWSLCALSGDVVLLLKVTGELQAVSLDSLFSAHKFYPIQSNGIYQVAFDSQTDTLLLVVQNATGKSYELVSLGRDTNGWSVKKRLSVDIDPADSKIAVCLSRLLLRGRYDKLHVFDVSATHSVSAMGYLALGQENEFYGFSCTRRDNDTYIALTHASSVSLHRLVSSQPLQLVELANFTLFEPKRSLPHKDLMLFLGARLLVANYNENTQTHAIVTLRASENALTDKRIVNLDSGNDAGVQVNAWTLAGDRLVLWGSNSKSLYVYRLRMNNNELEPKNEN